jgi:2-polyprenyl-3-methyl-5-hydroxy-6-metoxy-1,4-benzoquinol methylase
MDSKDTKATVGRESTHAHLCDYFDERTNYWHTLYGGGTFINRHMIDRKNTVLSMLDQISNGRRLKVLDLGCGAGILTQCILRMGHSVVSLDCSANMLRQMMQSLNGSHTEAFLGAVRSLAADTCFPDKHFDVIVCVGVIQYQLNEDLLIKEISRLLKSGGFCVFSLPNLLSINHLTDPIYLFRALRRIWTRGFVRKDKCAGNTGAFRFVGEPDDSRPYNKKYLQWEIRRPIEKYGMVLQTAVGLGYGPLTLMTKDIFPETLSILISKTLTNLLQHNVLSWLSCFANRWVFLAQKA